MRSLTSRASGSSGTRTRWRLEAAFASRSTPLATGARRARSRPRRNGIRTGGDPRNREYAPVEADGVDEELLALGYDAQTAGGLLVSLPADKALSLETEFRAP